MRAAAPTLRTALWSPWLNRVVLVPPHAMPMSENTILVAHRGETIEMVHGVPVADPYRWLEDAGSRETRDWTAEL